MYVLYGASQFSAYAVLNSVVDGLEQSHGISVRSAAIQLLFVGAGAGMTSTLVTYPFDLLRTRLAANADRQFLLMSKTVQGIFRTDGALGFFAGIRPTMLSVASTTGLMFWLYELARDLTRKHENIPFKEGFCGFFAGAVSKGITFPLDTLRKRMQVLSKVDRTGAFSLFRGILRSEGLLGFYRGFLISVLKTAPTSAISLFVYEYALELIGGPRKRL